MGFEGTLRAGDEIEIHYATSLRTEPAGAERVAFRVGPWLLGAPADENPAYANELTLENRIRTETSGEAGATPGERSFAVPVAARSFGFVSAEFPDQPARVTLRAVAEQTGRPTTSWELRFLTAKG
jgi:hypothetical protein